MSTLTLGAVAGNFGRDINKGVAKIVRIIESASNEGVDLLAFPAATLGGYVDSLDSPNLDNLPPTVELDGPELAEIAAATGDMIVCVGLAEAHGEMRYNTAVALSGEGILGVHRKVHHPVRESLVYVPGNSFSAFDTSIGRIGMLIDYDKTFPEAARSLALQGAQIIVALSAWPASVTDRASRLPADRQSRLFDLYDCARAAENQVVIVSSNLTGITGKLQFLGQAKVVGPGGEILSTKRSKGGMAKADIDVASETARSRKVLDHLGELRPELYTHADNPRTE